MGITYHMSKEVVVRKFNESPFTECGTVNIHPNDLFKLIPNDVFQQLESFPTQKAAKAFCEQWGFRNNMVIQIDTRFERPWIIGLGRSTYVPINALGWLFAFHSNRRFLGVS